MASTKAISLMRQALFCLDEAGLGASPAACYLQSALDAGGYRSSAREMEQLLAALTPVPELG